MPASNLSPQRSSRQVFETAATSAIVIALLYFGAGIFVPLVLAVLFAFALTPLVDFLGRRLRLPDPAAVVLAVLIAVVVLGAFAYLVGSQMVHLAQDFPKYQTTVIGKIRSVQSQLGNADFVEQVIGAYRALFRQFDAATASTAPGVAGQAPIPVSVSNEGAGPLGLVGSFLGSVLGPLATAAIVTVFLIFLLLGRGDLRDRFFRLASQGGYSATTRAIGDASARLGRYLLTQLAVNAVYGTIFGTGLMLIGVPGAMLWGLMIAVFRYIPYVGALIVAVIPFLLAFAVDPGWTMLAMTVALYLALDLTTSNIVEPRLYGSSTGVSPLALLLAAMFWATLWGPVGLILSTPMTVCLVVLGRYVPQFKLFETLLGSEPVLLPSERFYQRLLKGDTVEAIEIADEIAAAHGKDALYDEVMLPALRLAAAELSERPEEFSQRRQFAAGIESVIAEYGEAGQVEGSRVLLVAGRTEFDEDAARIVAQRLAGRDIASRVLPPIAVRPENIARIDLEGAALVCLFFVGPGMRAQTRYVVRRLRQLDPRLVCLAVVLDEDSVAETAETLHVERVAHDFGEALQEIEAALENAGEIAPAAPGEPVPGALFGAGRGNEALDRALEAVADDLGVPLATVNLLADERHADDIDAYRLTQQIAASATPLVVHLDDNSPDEAANAYLLTNGVAFYAAVPLLGAGGEAIGTLAILDYKAHPFGPEGIEALTAHAARLMELFAGNTPPPPQVVAANLSSKA